MIYICIPTHNEQQTVGVVLWKLRQVLTEFRRDYQLLVADDASSDKTPDVLEPYTRVLPLTVIRNDRRLGQAASLEMLLREAVRRSEYPKRDVIITLQADFSEEPDDVVPMIKRIEAGADLVAGNKVSVTRPARTWRLARALGSFFTRGQQWPEGVATPFEGYRAYRLYGVKRALEETAGRRLVRYDGWAGHAELLRAVLPHARRVEALDVEDRPDRMQRPRRERPFAAALQVRPMMRGVEPAGLVTVEELDRMAATASRSRDRTAPARRDSERASGYERTNGRARQRPDQAGRAGNGRDRRPSRAEASGRAEAPVRDQQPRRTGAEKPAAPRGPVPPKVRPRGEARQQGRPKGRSDVVEPHTPAAAAVTPTVEVELEAQSAAVDVTGAASAAPSPPKKRRRRRRRGSGGGAATGVETQPDSAGLADEPGPGDDATTSEREAVVEGSTETGEQKKRRRRGGRGRRRGSRAAGTEAAAAADTNMAAMEPPAAIAPAEPAPPVIQSEE